MSEAATSTFYRCRGCERPFEAWAKLKEHHLTCSAFIERAEGIRFTRESQGAHAGRGPSIHRRVGEGDLR
jgi:hypothetical protein